MRFKIEYKAQSGALSDRDYLLLLLRENHSITQTELAAMMEKSRRYVQLTMKQLMDEGVVERVGSKRIETWIHKIVFSFKLSYIKLIREKTGILLPIVLDSPTGREVKHDTVEKMLRIIQRDYSDHQLIIASIYDYDIESKNRIEFKNRMLDTDGIIKFNE